MIAYLLFAIVAECREETYSSIYDMFSWKYGASYVIVQILWYGDIPFALNVLASIKKFKEKSREGTESFVFFILFYLYNTLFLAGTWTHALLYSKEWGDLKGLDLGTAALRAILAAPMCLTLLFYVARRARRGEYAVDLPVVSSALITTMEMIYLVDFFMYPTYL